MKGLLTVLHPTFDSLSSLADRPMDSAPDGYVAAHVARCGRCQDVVTEIRALGAGARAIPNQLPANDIWRRIESAGLAGEGLEAAGSAPNEPPVFLAVPAPTPGRRRYMVPAIVASIAAVLVALLGWPSGRGLQANDLSRLSFTPGRPRPGGEMHVRYIAPAYFRGAPRLVLVGRYLPAPRDRAMSLFFRSGALLGDSMATLLPDRDGVFTATVHLPANFRAMQLSVSDSAGSRTDADGIQLWRVIGGDRTGAPSLEALLAAVPWDGMFQGSVGSVAPSTQSVNVSDSLRRYFPEHPAGWAYARGYQRQQGILGLIGYFQSAERRYASMSDRLIGEPRLDAERLADMAAFARSISEPDEAMSWTTRLVHEHPEEQRALPMLALALHEIELREPRRLADSIRAWLPVLDSLYGKAPHVGEDLASVLPLIDRYADSSSKARWRRRMYDFDNVPYFSNRWFGGSMLSDIPDEALERLRTEASVLCGKRAPGKFPLMGTAAGWQTSCLMSRARLLHTLADIALVRGDPRKALSLADSSSDALRSISQCVGGRFQATRTAAWAKLALGDTVGAARAFALAYGAGGPNKPSVDSVRAALGRRFNEATWAADSGSASREMQACLARLDASTRERRAANHAK